MINLALLKGLIGASTWLLTLALHSVVTQAIALLLGSRLVQRPRQRDVLWKAALLLPFVTATATMSGIRPMVVTRDLDLPALVRAVRPAGWSDRRVETRVIRTGPAAAEQSVFATDTTAAIIATVVSSMALVAALGGLIQLARRRRRFRQHIGTRTPVTGFVTERTGGVDGQVHWTTSESLTVPVALCWREVCMPADMNTTLTTDQHRSVVTHELAHVARRDPAWFALTDLVVALMPWQPLVRQIARGFRRDAEFICDEVVVHRIGEGRTLVQSLIVFASRFDRCEAGFVASCDGSPLEARARRLLSGELLELPPARRWTIGLALLMLVAVAAAAPAISTRTRPGSIGRPGPGRMIREIDSTVVYRQGR